MRAPSRSSSISNQGCSACRESRATCARSRPARTPEAKGAIDLFVYRIGRELGSLAAALGGLDAIVFTAGIGENSRSLRERVCGEAAWLGVEVDADANDAMRAGSAPPQVACRSGYSDQRGADDRSPHAQPARRVTANA
jgi:acetate kinase